MKFNKKNQLGLNFTQYYKDNLFRIHFSNYQYYPNHFLEPYKEQWTWLLDDKLNKNLFFTKTALSIVDKIKIEKFKPETLKSKKDIKHTFLVDENSFYRMTIKSKIIPESNIVIHPNKNYLEDKNFVQFLKLLIFTEYSELKERVLLWNQTHT